MRALRSAAPTLRTGLLLMCSTSLLGLAARGQSHGGMELHANGNVTAAEVGLPAFPGATLYKEPGNDSGAVDLGMTFGDFHFRVVAASYLTSASPDRVLDFYRKPLARYGDVIECDHGKPVGAAKMTKSGLTCSDSDHDSHLQFNGESSDGHELRAGTPHHFRIVGIGEPKDGSTHFGLVEVELPKDSDKKSD